jgi:hypothetical protein
MVMVLALLTVGTAVYVSPLVEKAVSATSPAPLQLPARARPHDLKPLVTPVAATKPTTTTPTSPPTKVVVRYVSRPQAPATATTTPRTTTTVAPTTTTTTTPAAKTVSCSSFKWQQDAQAAYEANLSDPYGLDGAPGPFNGDGLACSNLPVDPSRPASTPEGAYVPPTPTVAARATLVTPSTRYYGVAQNGLPNANSQLDAIDSEVGKAPSVIEWFSGWDQSFNAQSVTNSWDNGALPIITWETKPLVAGDTSTFTLANIIAGNYDSYIYQYAIAVARTNLPVVIRLDQESNGTWYPWSEAADGNSPGQYVAMWRHVWNIFNEVGANQDVIWLWSPNRMEYMGGGGTPFSQSYPGNQYVDWLGLDGYYRTAGNPTDFASSFGTSISLLNAISSTKPIFLSEIGAIESDSSGNSVAAAKASWITNVLNAVQADPQIIGFAWFDNSASTTTDGVSTTNDWDFDSDPQALAAFKSEVDSSGFAGGLMPDGSESP